MGSLINFRMVHGTRINGKAHGVVNTKASVVAKMLDLVDYTENKDLSGIVVLEPAAGEGAFVVEIIRRIYYSSLKFGFDFKAALSNVYVCELNEEIYEELRGNVLLQLQGFGIYEHHVNFILGDFLQTVFCVKFDLIIGNPPYVRNENIPKALKEIYELAFRTFSHRSDLYIPFYEKALRLLKANGVLSFLCSNRWLKNQYGKKIREFIANHFHVDMILDLEKADVFDEEVLGYPAITNISKCEKSTDSLYFKVDDLDSFLEFEGTTAISKVLNIRSSNWFSYLRTGAPYEKSLKSIEQQNYKIGIGVATGRDSVFISDCFKGQIEEALLIPILTSKDIKGVNIDWQGNYIINPFDEHGNLINLAEFPRAQSYFNEHKEDLLNRHIAKKDATKWYKTIDKIQCSLVSKPKVILPDISGNRFIHVDKGDYYPHHNLYYIVGGSYDEMCLVACLLMSDFAYMQLLEAGNKMKGGYPRWQSQNLRKLLLPTLNSIPNIDRVSLLEAYQQKDIPAINEIITKERIALYEVSEGQLLLFEPRVKYEKEG